MLERNEPGLSGPTADLPRDGGAVPIPTPATAMAKAELDFQASCQMVMLQARMEALQRRLEDELGRRHDRIQALAKLVHELRTPLNGILGALSLLKGETMDASRRRLLQLVEAAGWQQARVIDDILDFARLDAQRLVLVETEANLRPLMEECVEFMRPQAQLRGLELGLNLPEGLPARVQVDVHRLRQVLLNLLSNAIRYTDVGGVSLTANVLPSGSANEVTVSFRIVDTGRGMRLDPLADLDLMFRRERDDAQTPPGSGIGLTVIRELLRLMGSHLEMDSAPDRGTSVRFTLTLKAC